jgi:hypothetical protein
MGELNECLVEAPRGLSREVSSRLSKTTFGFTKSQKRCLGVSDGVGFWKRSL